MKQRTGPACPEPVNRALVARPRDAGYGWANHRGLARESLGLARASCGTGGRVIMDSWSGPMGYVGESPWSRARILRYGWANHRGFVVETHGMRGRIPVVSRAHPAVRVGESLWIRGRDPWDPWAYRSVSRAHPAVRVGESLWIRGRDLRHGCASHWELVRSIHCIGVRVPAFACPRLTGQVPALTRIRESKGWDPSADVVRLGPELRRTGGRAPRDRRGDRAGCSRPSIASRSPIAEHHSMRFRVSVAAVAMLAAACGSSGPSTPSEQCINVSTALCTHLEECAVVAGVISESQTGANVSSCESSFQTAADCSGATQVTGDPDACMADFRAVPCSEYDPTSTTGLPVPLSCARLFR
jgi:hypothetical protein